MMKYIVILIILGFNKCSSSQVLQDKTILHVKYIPFSSHFNIRVSENDLTNMESKKFLIVKKDSVYNTSTNKLVLDRIKLLKKKEGQKTTYDLRMECNIAANGENIQFYIDKNKNVVLNGNVYNDAELVNTILGNICRPYFSIYLDDEKMYWMNNSHECNDSIDFFKYYPR